MVQKGKKKLVMKAKRTGKGKSGPRAPFVDFELFVCWVIKNLILQRGDFRVLDTFGRLQVPTKTGFLFSLFNFRTVVFQFGSEKNKFGRSKVFHSDHRNSILSSVELVHLVKKVHEGP